MAKNVKYATRFIVPNAVEGEKKRLSGDIKPHLKTHEYYFPSCHYYGNEVPLNVMRATAIVFLEHILTNMSSTFTLFKLLLQSILRVDERHAEAVAKAWKDSKNYSESCVRVATRFEYIYLRYQHLRYFASIKQITMAMIGVIQYYLPELRKIKKADLLEKKILNIFRQDPIFGFIIIDKERQHLRAQNLAVQIGNLKQLGILNDDYTLTIDELGSKRHLIILELIMKYAVILELSNSTQERYKKEIAELYSKLRNK